MVCRNHGLVPPAMFAAAAALPADSGLELTVSLAMNELRESLAALDSIISKPYRQVRCCRWPGFCAAYSCRLTVVLATAVSQVLDKSVSRAGLADGATVKRYLDATKAKVQSVERLLNAEARIAVTTGQQTEEKLTASYVMDGAGEADCVAVGRKDVPSTWRSR